VRVSNPLEEKLIALIEPAAADLGYRLVRVRVSGLRRKTLQIMAERVADGLMALEDCESLSRAISPVLDANDPIQGAYSLEVSSPGIDRPLVNLDDFTRFKGHHARVETSQMIDGRRRFKGPIVGVEGDAAVLQMEAGPVRIPFAWMASARLELTDALIEEDLRNHAAAAAAANPKPKPSPKPKRKSS
jgi:ribosome maturation factor RimP